MRSITVEVGTPVILTSGGDDSSDSLPVPAVVSVLPGAGGTLLVEYQVIENGSWTDWPGGAAAVKTIYVLTGPIYSLRFTAAVSNGTAETTL